MKKTIFVFILISVLVFGFIVFKVTKERREDEVIEDTPKIGLSFDSLVVERWKRDLETFVGIANEKGFEVIVQIANDDLNEQRKQIQYLIDENVSVLVILPNDFDALSEEIRLAKRKNIKVIAYDRMIANADVDAYITFDNINNGELITEKLFKELPVDDQVKNIIIINGDPKDYNSYMLNEGFNNVINEKKGDINFEILEEIWAYGWREFHAFNIVEKVLDEGKKIDAIIAANDVLATGAIEALAERQLAGEVLVVSQDAELSACQRIVEGTQIATIYKPINLLAETAVELSIRLINNDELNEFDKISDGTYDIPYVGIKCQVVDIENIDDIIINSGFHSRENVYMNVR